MAQLYMIHGSDSQNLNSFRLMETMNVLILRLKFAQIQIFGFERLNIVNDRQ